MYYGVMQLRQENKTKYLYKFTVTHCKLVDRAQNRQSWNTHLTLPYSLSRSFKVKGWGYVELAGWFPDIEVSSCVVYLCVFSRFLPINQHNDGLHHSKVRSQSASVRLASKTEDDKNSFQTNANHYWCMDLKYVPQENQTFTRIYRLLLIVF